MNERFSEADANYQEVLRRLEAVERASPPSPRFVPPTPAATPPFLTSTPYLSITTPAPGLPYPTYHPYPPHSTSPPHTATASMDPSLLVAIYVGMAAGGLVVLVLFLAGSLYLWRYCRVSGISKGER